MKECEVCGKREAVTKAEIEGVVLEVCEKCAKFGKEVRTPKLLAKPSKPSPFPALSFFEDETPIENLGEVVKKLREEKKLSQEELAKAVKESVSIIKRIEEGWVPPVKIVEKLEKFFKVLLREKAESFLEKKEEKKEKAKLTIGDVADIKGK